MCGQLFGLRRDHRVLRLSELPLLLKSIVLALLRNITFALVVDLLLTSYSRFLGFTLASLALLGYWADADPLVAISNPLLIFSVLIYDMTYITVARIAPGKVRSFFEWIDYTGQDHLHHRIAAVLDSRAKAVVFILLMNASLGIAALGLRAAEPGTAFLLLVQALLILVLVTMLERRGKSLLTD